MAGPGRCRDPGHRETDQPRAVGPALRRSLGELGDGRTRLMGVLNLTPDSFSDGGRFGRVEDAVRHGLALVEQGADVLDLGGESTRPGYARVPPDEQLRRILPVLAALRPQIAVPISIDTTRARVAAQALEAGADWINDTSALREDPELGAVAAAHGCPIVLMHRFDPPLSTADAPARRGTVMPKIIAGLRRAIDHAAAAGIARDAILLDPGVGFGTRAEDNHVIHAHIEDLRALGRPLVVGPSRKSFLGALTGRPAAERGAATAACVAALATAGVEVIRVHDVAPMRDVVVVLQAFAAVEET